MKYPKVNVTVIDRNYEVMVAVYRHVSTPNEIHVVIQAIRPVPPLPMEISRDDVAKVLKGGGPMVAFDVEKTYPYQKNCGG